ncbi:MAG TPA: CBS domain-containing protein [Anaeromyxobacteraceae bacterium]|jgi:CBS domain-containing protein|nr:CBS domain-containing protein [Anaeromyxobacteraceae bacterium]
MRDHRKSRIMVCDQDGKLAGVISLSDVADLEEEAAAGRTLREVSSRETRQPHAS